MTKIEVGLEVEVGSSCSCSSFLLGVVWVVRCGGGGFGIFGWVWQSRGCLVGGLVVRLVGCLAAWLSFQ